MSSAMEYIKHLLDGRLYVVNSNNSQVKPRQKLKCGILLKLCRYYVLMQYVSDYFRQQHALIRQCIKSAAAAVIRVA